MSTLQERLGVAVESDAARFMGGDFAEGHGAGIARRIKRRRAARAASYSGGTMLAVGALAVGATKLPWGSIGGAIQPGAAGCVTPSPTGGAALAPAGADVVYSSAVNVEDGSATVTVPGRDGTAAEPSTPRYVVTYTSDGNVHVVTAEGDEFGVHVSSAAPAHFVGADGREVTIDLGPDGDVLSVTVEAQEGEALSLEEPEASPSSDCATPEPAETPTEEPILDDETAYADLSPFQCGYVFEELDGSTGVITIAEPHWVSAASAEASVLAFHEEGGITLGLSGEDVPLVTFTAQFPGERSFYGSETGPLDPATYSEAPYVTVDGQEVKGGYVVGAQFVLVLDGAVVATYDGSLVDEFGVTQYIDGYDVATGTLYGLNLTAGFTPCDDVEPGELDGAQPVAVVGATFWDGEGSVDGPYYAWRFIVRG